MTESTDTPSDSRAARRLPPTWRRALPIYIHTISTAPDDARDAAIDELYRLADYADAMTEAQTEVTSTDNAAEDELRKIAERLGDAEDPYAAWESIDLLQRQHAAMLNALTDIAAFNDKSASETLRLSGSYVAFDEPGAVQTARTTLVALGIEV